VSQYGQLYRLLHELHCIPPAPAGQHGGGGGDEEKLVKESGSKKRVRILNLQKKRALKNCGNIIFLNCSWPEFFEKTSIN
jgi:hypothetical protein